MMRRLVCHGALLCLMVMLMPGIAHAQAATDTTPAVPVAPTPPPADAANPSDTVAPKVGGTESYDLKLRELEERVVGLKERIFRTKTRLLLLKERILNDVIAEAKAVLLHVNDMGGSFEPMQVIYHLDGEKIFFQDNINGTLSSSEPIEIYAGNVMPGNHVMSVEMLYRGNSSVFVYLKDYIIRLRANYTFYATKGKITQVRSVGYLKGDATYDITERPSIKFAVQQVSYIREELGGTPPGARAGASTGSD
jgi:hypothetical protein